MDYKTKLGTIKNNHLVGMDPKGYYDVFHDLGLVISAKLQLLGEKTIACPHEYEEQYGKKSWDKWREELQEAAGWFKLLSESPTDFLRLPDGEEYWNLLPVDFRNKNSYNPDGSYSDKVYEEIIDLIDQIKEQAFTWLKDHWWELWD